MLKRPINFIKGWTNFSWSQRKAALVLCTIVVLLCVFPFFYDAYLRPKSNLVLEQKLINQLESQNTEQKHKYQFSPKGKVAKWESVDLNQAKWADLVKAGIDKKLANRIINFRTVKKGYESFEDVSKVYSIRPEDVAILKEKFYLKEKDNEKKLSDAPSVSKTQLPKIVNINLADSLELIAIRGIGPSYAKRILKYRNLLGGYYTVKQIKEVYGIHDTIFQKLELSLICSGKVTKVNLNELSVKGIARHPYISYKKAKMLVAYRTQHGTISNASILKKATFFSESDMKRILPYVEF